MCFSVTLCCKSGPCWVLAIVLSVGDRAVRRTGKAHGPLHLTFYYWNQCSVSEAAECHGDRGRSGGSPGAGRKGTGPVGGFTRRSSWSKDPKRKVGWGAWSLEAQESEGGREEKQVRSCLGAKGRVWGGVGTQITRASGQTRNYREKEKLLECVATGCAWFPSFCVEDRRQIFACNRDP